MAFILLALGILFVFVLSGGQSNASVVMCSSFSCAYNKRARCARKEITIYDNVVLGLCLFHSETMSKRILEPMRRGIAVKRGESDPQMIDKIMKSQEEELVKNPKAFTKWMRKQVIGKNRR